MKVIAYGGGVQSTALVVLATQGELDYQYALFSNVGDKAEHPDTLAYVSTVMTPWAKDRDGPQVVTLHKEWQRGDRKGQVVDLWDEIVDRDKRSIPIPIRMPDTGAPGNRLCTIDYKVRVVSRWIRDNADTDETQVAIGISTDEYQRASRRKDIDGERAIYPLLDLNLSRSDCQNIISDAGLPVPRKSSCFFCPFHKPSHFAEMRRDDPELFQRAAELETLVNVKRDDMGKDHVYLTRFGMPLADAVPVAQEPLFQLPEFQDMDNDGACDEGYCFV